MKRVLWWLFVLFRRCWFIMYVIIRAGRKFGHHLGHGSLLRVRDVVENMLSLRQRLEMYACATDEPVSVYQPNHLTTS